jgi:biopolymer transport protein TolR
MARHKKRSLVANMNVVPYIDVMLVLLVIFMVTAPMLQQGVKVDLPQAASTPVSKEQEPLIIAVDAQGNYYLEVGDDAKTPMPTEILLNRVAAVQRMKPGTAVLVRGDRNVPYGDVVTLMAVLKNAGVPSVGLMTENPH